MKEQILYRKNTEISEMKSKNKNCFFEDTTKITNI